MTCWLSGERSLPFGLLVNKFDGAFSKVMVWSVICQLLVMWWRLQECDDGGNYDGVVSNMMAS